MRAKNLMFDWESPLTLGPDALLQPGPRPGLARVCSAGLLSLYDRETRSVPAWSVDLDPRSPRCWDLFRHTAFVLSEAQRAVLLEFFAPATPTAVQRKHPGLWARDVWEDLLGLLLARRILVPERGRPRARAARPKLPDTGVVLIGLGDRYVRLAANLAESIRANAPQLPIVLVHGAADLRKVQSVNAERALFDQLVAVERRDFQCQGVFSPFLLKLNLDRLSPFRSTLFMDADSLVFPGRSLEQELASYRGADFAGACSAVFRPTFTEAPLMFGLDLAAMQRVVPALGPVARISSYYLFFRRSPATRDLFDAARKIHSALEGVADFPRYKGVIPDEPIFAAASGLVPLRLHAGYHMPFVERAVLDGAFDLLRLRSRHLGLTFVGNPEPEGFIRGYDSVVREVAALRDNPRPTLWADAG